LIAFGPAKGGKPYAQGDRDLIVKLAAHVSALIGTREELASARQVQQRFFPGRLQPIRGLDYYGECREAGEVSGDFFDFVAPDRSCLLLSIGDVSAKGIPAAIVMAGLQASLRALGPGSRNRISTLVRDLNRVVCQLSPDRFYTTMFYARVDSARRELHYVNAGHEPPLIVRKRNNAVVELGATGTVLGLSPRTAYEQRTVPLEPGDVLVAVTEGVAEALCARGPGAHRKVVIEAVRDQPGAPSSEVAGRIIGAVEASAGGAAAEDDRAVVVVRLLETGVVELIDKRRAFHHEPARARERLEPLLA
jgi:phosphoserine phosphatase RsbU/P